MSKNKVDIIIAGTFKNQDQDLIVGTLVKVNTHYGSRPEKYAIIKEMSRCPYRHNLIIRCTYDTGDRMCIDPYEFERGDVIIEPKSLTFAELEQIVGEPIYNTNEYYDYDHWTVLTAEQSSKGCQCWCGGLTEWSLKVVSSYPFRHIAGCYLSRDSYDNKLKVVVPA